MHAASLREVKPAAEQAQVNVEFIAAAIGGVQASDGHGVPADQKTDSGPSVFHQAVVLLASSSGSPALSVLPATRDFAADAHAYYKSIRVRRRSGGRCPRRPGSAW